jgi:hypothetical protein
MPIEPAAYVTRPRGSSFAFSVVVRPHPGVADIAPSVLKVVSEQLPPRASASIDTWLRNYDAQMSRRRFIAGIFITLSVASLILAGAGLFGVLSYAAVMALGGTAIGAVIAFWAAFMVYGWLWGVYPIDVGALLVTEGILFAIAISATALPALQAARANPVDAMRAT